jgi:SET domain-containing protein
LVDGAGWGLFASSGQSFKKGDFITAYEGRLIDRKEADTLREKGLDSHVIAVESPWSYIDGNKDRVKAGGGASYANHNAEKYCNAKFVRRFDQRTASTIVVLQATKYIWRGEEIFANYGKTYWAKIADRLLNE